MDMISVPVTEARATLPALIDRVEAGEEVTLTRHGKPVAVLLAPSAVRARRSSKVFELAAEVRRGLEAARDLPFDSTTGLSPEFADDLIRDIRAGRDARG